ncbi:MAG: aminotransferase class III-fold pyridoxal phosphate-dependent enzyme [Bacteriovoracaceae bacterium]|nr:aminotransferase class III-fold pyridoxal phosphate-dependent enzyme [Bacteriovoracaceae bacterium]
MGFSDVSEVSDDVQNQVDQLFSVILKRQQQVNSLKRPIKGKEKLIEKTLGDYAKFRGRGFFYNYLSSGKGHGPFTELVDGSVKFDLINAIGVNLLGHSHPLYIKAHLEAALSDSIMCGNLLPYQESYKAMGHLLKAVEGSRLKHFWFAGSGSFANDTALKLIWQKKAPAYKIIAFDNCFAGRSVATQNITSNVNYREGMPTSVEVEHVPHYDYRDPVNSLKNTIKAMDEVWQKDPGAYCALEIELIQGEAGFIYGTKEYYEGVFKWAKDKGLYIWVDEVQTFGRTRELFAYQMFGLDKYVDIVTIGKALQACGTFYTEELNPKPGLIAGTFHGSLVSLNAASKIIEYLTGGNFYGDDGRIQELEKQFICKLNHLMQGSCKGIIRYVGGIGTMISFEVADASKEQSIKFLKQLFNNGIIAFSAGKDPVRIRFLLPLCLTDEHINQIFQILEMTLHEVFKPQGEVT